MAFDYGSDDLGIKNPFKKEGAVFFITGLIIAVLGVLLILKVQGLVESGDKPQAWLTLGIAILLLTSGLTAAGRGLYKAMRFFVGRGIPTSLAKNVAKSESHINETGVEYSSQILEQMMQGRKNMTFTEPIGWSTRLAHTIFPRLLFLPYAFRNISRQITSGFVHTAFAILCYALAGFFGMTGLFPLEGTPVMNWLGFLLTAFIIRVWLWRRKPLQASLQQRMETDTLRGLVFWITLAIVLPFALLYFHQNVTPLPEIHISSMGYILMTTALVAILSVLSSLMLYFRLAPINPATEISEYRDNWQESIHPQELLIHFENIIMANRRYKEIPNRIYRGFDARLVEEGSDDKGHFNAEMIQETQPQYKPLKAPPVYDLLRLLSTIIGRGMIVASAVILYYLAGSADIADSSSFQTILSSLSDSSALFFQAVILWIFGGIITIYANGFWAEILYESDMVFFQCEGTYTQSKISTGSSILDSTRSENTIVRSSLTPWILTCKIVTSSFTKSGPNNFAFPRLVMEMHKSDQSLDSIVKELRQFIAERQNIAGVHQVKDLEAASQIHQINEQSRKSAPHIPGTGNVPGIPEEILPNSPAGDKPSSDE